MVRKLTAGIIALPFLAAGAAALPPQESSYIGSDEVTIRAALISMGFQVVSFGLDETGYEAEVLDGDVIYDISINPDTGIIDSVEIDTDADGDV